VSMPAGIPGLPEPELELHAEFDAFFKSFSSGNRDGNLILNFGVPPDQKHLAFPVTDLEGQLVVVRVMARNFGDLDLTFLGGDRVSDGG
jgi:hypothetical protein